MRGKSGKELANLTTLQARILLRSAEALWDQACNGRVDLDLTDQWAMSQAMDKLRAALGEGKSMLPAK